MKTLYWILVFTLVITGTVVVTLFARHRWSDAIMRAKSGIIGFIIGNVTMFALLAILEAI